MLQIRNLRKSFGDLQVLKSIDLDVNKGDVVAILGPSGSGKTTMLRCLNFLEKSDGGTMLFDNQRVDLARVTHAEANALRRRTGRISRIRAEPVQPADHRRKAPHQQCIQCHHPPPGHRTAPFEK